MARRLSPAFLERQRREMAAIPVVVDESAEKTHRFYSLLRMAIQDDDAPLWRDDPTYERKAA